MQATIKAHRIIKWSGIFGVWSYSLHSLLHITFIENLCSYLLAVSKFKQHWLLFCQQHP